MAVTSTTPSIQYTANGSTTEFAFTFVVPASDSGGTITTSTGSISASDQTLTVTATDFFYTTDLVGKAITVAGAGSGSATLETTILSRTSGTVVELTDAASTTVSGQNVVVTTGTYATTLNTNSDIQVYVDGVLKSYTTHYTVLLNVGDDANKAGKVVFGSAPAADSIVTIQRDVTLARTTDFQTGGALTAKTLNSEFDTMIMAIQDTQFDTTAGAVKFPADETPSSSYIPAKATRASKVLGFDANGEFSMKNDISSGTVGITATTGTFNNILRSNVRFEAENITNFAGNQGIHIASGSTPTVTMSSVDINAGAIDGTTIGAATPSTGAFTTLSSTGATVLRGLTYPSSDGSDGQVLKTDGNGNLAFESVAGLSLFTALTDTPANYSGAAGKYLKVNSGASAIEFDILTTDDVSEGSNLYYTDGRADTRITNATIDEDDFASDSATKLPTQQSVKAYIASQIATKDNSDEITEGSTNLYFTNARARSAVSVTDSGGDGSLAYNSSTGVITYTGPSASEVRAHITATSPITISSGDISISDASTSAKGIASFSANNFDVSSGAVTLKNDGITDLHLNWGTGTNQISTDDIPEGSNKKFFTTNGGAINTDSLPEGSTNLYFTNARADARVIAGSINSVVEDSTPQLGGHLDTNGQDLVSTSNQAIEIKPNGTGAFNVETQGNIELKAGVGTLQGNGWQWLSDDTIKILQHTAPDSSNSQFYNIASGDYGVAYAPLHLQGGMSIGGGTSATVDLLFNTGIQIEADTKGFPAVVLKTKSSGNQDGGNDRFGNIWFARSGSDTTDAYVTENATIGGFYCSPYDADDGDYYNVTAKFLATATEDHSDGAMGTMMQWFVTKDGTKSLKEALRMKGNRVEVNPGNNNIDFRVDGDTNDGVLFVDAGTERVGVKTTSPSADLEVNGTFKATSFDSSLTLATIGDVAYPSSPTDGQFLKWVNANSRWEPATIGVSGVLAGNLDTQFYAIQQGDSGISINTTNAPNYVYSFTTNASTGAGARDLHLKGGTHLGSTDAKYTGAIRMSEASYIELGVISKENWLQEHQHSEDFQSNFSITNRGQGAVTIGLPFDQQLNGDRNSSWSDQKRGVPTLKFVNRGKAGESAISTTLGDGAGNDITETTRGADAPEVKDFAYGGAITTEHAETTGYSGHGVRSDPSGSPLQINKWQQDISVPNCNDLLVGAFPIGDQVALDATMDTAVVGDTVIMVGGKSNNTITGSNSIGSSRDPMHYYYNASEVRNAYLIEEAVRFESPSTGSLASQTFTLNANKNMSAGAYLTQAVTGATARVKTDITNSNQVVVINVTGSWNTSNAFQYRYGSTQTDNFAQPTNLGSTDSGAIVNGGGRATFGVPITFANKTTTERNALTAAEGMMLYNSTTDRVEVYGGSSPSWGALGGGAADDYFATSGLSAKDLGVGLHIKTGDCGGGTIAAGRDELVIEGSGSTGMTLIGGASNDIGIGFGDSSNTNIGLINYNNTNNYMTFQSNDSERMRIRSNGTTSFNDSAATNTKNDWAIKLLQNTNDSATNYMMVFANASDTTLGSIQTNGSSSTSYNTSSDYRLKENVVDMTDATTRLKQLQPKRFNFIADADTTVDGFLAHEVSSIVPEAISGVKDAVKEDGTIIPQQIDQSKLVPLLVKTIQELEARIKTLEDNQ